MTAMLSYQRYMEARAFIDREARPLDVALMRQALGEASAGAVLEALAPFQNSDGGFGHGLEPDMAAAASSAIATSVGLRLIRRTGAGADHPMVRRALDWLAANLDEGVWPIVPRAIEEAPHAPWWAWSPELAENWNGFRFNPTAELLAALYHWRAGADPHVLAIVEEAMLSSIAAAEVIGGAYDLLSAVRLLETTETPARLRAVLTPLLIHSVAEHDADDPHLPALELASSPGSLLAVSLERRIDAAAAQMIETQDADGGWSPFWDWSSIDAAAWAKARADWRGWLTRSAIEALRAHGRIAAA